ncbi:MAG: LysR substrate-binding domain-containing protein, partial [Faecalibacterium sp.]
MDIRQLHYFLVLCEEMNYTRAAQRLFLSRQALRQSIAALEAELCGPLFASAHHKLTLTDRGASLQRHAAPVVEQFQQMQAALKAEIQSAQPVVIGISVSLVPDYLPGLETQLDKFRQQYPHIEMRFRLMETDAVADGVENGILDAGLVMDLGCAAASLARTTLRADPACLLVPRGHAFWEKESVPIAELRGQRVLLPGLRQDLFAPLWSACAQAGFAPNAEVGPSFYQAYYLVQEQLCTCLTRYEPGARRELDRVRDVLLEDLPPLCVSMVQRRDHSSAYVDLLRSYLMEVLGGASSLPPRRGRPAKPFYNFPVLSSAAARSAAPVPAHPAPGTELSFAGGHNFRELGGYEADEGKHVRWGQIYRGIPTAGLSSPEDRARL